MGNDIIGIDLGTTNSCAAIAGSCDKCFEIKDIQGYSIITDKRKRKTTPSVLAYTNDPDAPFEIGHKAKNMVDGKYPPVMFAKRDMGTDKTFRIDDDKTVSPVEVSAEILKYLKKMAEEKTGSVINSAVVTVPAYFNLPQKSLTRDAVEMAGFLTHGEKNIIQEPVAAALTFVQMNQSDDLLIMVYDLGGGTFDLTILKKNGTLIDVVKFGGDHALGGYNFDKKLADHILEELKDCDYALDLDPEKNPEDKMIYTKLLLLAEEAKIELTYKEEYSLRRPAYFKDQNGEVVDIDLSVSRDTFESLIKDLVELTIEESRRTLDESGLTIDQIDRIIMVGGSSFIPCIQQRLEKEFLKKPDLVEPDLCVAMGAAIYASQLGSVIEQEVIIHLDSFPANTCDDEIEIAGSVSARENRTLDQGYTVRIKSLDGSFQQSADLKGENAFYFEVPLEENSENTFTFEVLNPGGVVEGQTKMTINHSEDVDDKDDPVPLPPPNLSRSIFVKRKSGLRQLAPEGAILPFEETLETPIIKTSGSDDTAELALDVEILEEHNPIGTVTVSQIPASIENGAPAKIGIKITPDYQIIASVYLPTVDRKAKSIFSLGVVEIPSLEELEAELHNIQSEWEDRKKICDRSILAKFGPKMDKLFKRARSCLDDTQKDTTELSNVITTLKEMLTIIKSQDIVLQPSMEHFKRLCSDTRTMLTDAENKDAHFKQQNNKLSLDAIIRKAEEAWENKNQDIWEEMNNAVQELQKKADEILNPPGPVGPVDPKALLVQLMMLVNSLKQEIPAKHGGDPRLNGWMDRLDQIDNEINKAGEITDDEELLSEIRRIYGDLLLPLMEEMEIKDDDPIIRI